MDPMTAAAVMQGAGVLAPAVSGMVSKPIEIYAAFRAMKEREAAEQERRRRQARQDELREEGIARQAGMRQTAAIDKAGQMGENYQDHLMKMYGQFSRGSL